MHILQLCKKFPSPPKDGESIAVLAASRGYVKNGCQVSLLAMNTTKHYVENADIQPDITHYDSVTTSKIDNQKIDKRKAFFNLFTSKSFNIERFVCPKFEKKLIDLLNDKNFDVIQCESLYMAPYIETIRKYSKAKVVMRSHNLEFEIWENLSKSNKNIFKSWYFNLCAKRLKKYEIDCFPHYDLLLPISTSDYKKYLKLGYKKKLHLANVGLNLENYKSSRYAYNSTLKMGYIGSLDWKPNIEGIKWFFKNIWHNISSKYADIEFHLAGRNPVPEILKLKAKQMIMYGEVKSAKDFLENLDIVVVPLLSGSGIRIKILESMAMSKVVMSTTKGFEGINIEDNTNAILFNTVDEFENKITPLLENREIINQIASKAQDLIKKDFDYRNVAKGIIEAIKSI